ncbi:MAG: IMP cyclohydrolase [Coriobacteriia bacterium]|nr:IMP cyclohydrolase [Coriobacteriia bacterium]
MADLLELLKSNPYPGRGIVVGKDCVYYWIMGRSSNSRNRIFCLEEDGIRTEAFDPSKLEDPSLIIYHPVRKVDGALIVTNGDQTDTIRDLGWREGCMAREYEPDAPNFTPRISAYIREDGTFEISILKHNDGTCQRNFFCYEGVEEGNGYFISTYQGDGNPLPTFAGEPIKVDMPAPEQVWEALNADNKVSLYANVGGKVTLWNKNQGQ